MRRTLAAVCTGLLGLTVVTVATGALARAAHVGSQLQANRVAAEHDARRLLADLRLPLPRVSATPRIPAFARPWLSNASPVSRYYATAERWVIAEAAPKAIISYVEHHPPAGSTLDLGSGTSRDSKTGVSSIDARFSWPDVSEKLLGRSLTVTIVTPRHGRSVVVAQSQSAWFVPRPADERVPAGVHAVKITVRLGPSVIGPAVQPGGKVDTTTRLISRAGQVAALIGRFDDLPIVQPSLAPIPCPMMLTGSSASVLTLAFIRGHHGSVLARAQVLIHRGQHSADGGGPCDPIDFTIQGDRQVALTSPTFVKQVGKLVGADIS